MQPLINVDGFQSGKSFPDLDMLNPYQNASNDPDFRAQMTLWSIARSPLIYGADLRSPSLTADDFALLTNPGMLNITKASTDNRPVDAASTSDYVVWTAKSSVDSGTHYVAIISRATSQPSSPSIALETLGIHATSCKAHDIWADASLGQVSKVTTKLPAGPHYYGQLFSLSNCQ